MQIKERINAISRLCQIGKELSSSTDIDELLAKISRASSEICRCESASIILLDEDSNEMYFKEVSGELGEIIKKIRIPLNEKSIAGWCILNRQPQIINDVSVDPRHYKKVDQTTKFTTRSILAVPIMWGDRVFGCVEAVNKKRGKEFNDKDLEYLTILAHQAAVALNNVFLMERLQNFFSHSVEILITALEALEPFARGHTIRVARLAVTIARKLGYMGKSLENIWYATYFHDVGKLAKESIYMTQQEIERLHPTMGASLIENIKILEPAANIIRNHHERIDGSGFPEGKRGDDIPEPAQILGISEDYDEMWTAVRDTQSREDFNREFLEYAKNKFQPEIINTLNDILRETEAYDRV